MWCAVGEILDIAVDIRRGSPTFGKFSAVILNAENRKQVYIPEGFAHGFLTLSKEDSLVYFLVNKYYNPDAESGIHYNDEDIAINWQMDNIQALPRDEELQALKDCHDFIY